MTASKTRLPAPVPAINPETKPFWDATADGKLLVRHCNACSENYFYPRTICPFCSSFDTDWLQASGRGTIYTFSVIRKGLGDFSEAGPYVLAYVELEEGPRVMTNIIDCDIDSLAVGDAVEVVFESTEVNAALYRFRPV